MRFFKLIIIVIGVLLMSYTTILGQGGLQVHSGSFTIDTSTTLMIANTSLVVKSGATFKGDTLSKVEFRGHDSQIDTIGGGGSFTFGHLRINKPDTQFAFLGSKISVENELTLSKGGFYCDDAVNLGSTGVLSGELLTSSRRFFGSLSGKIVASNRSVLNGQSKDVAGLGLEITPNDSITRIDVFRGFSTQQGLRANGNAVDSFSVYRYYEITTCVSKDVSISPTGDTIRAEMTIKYNNLESDTGHGGLDYSNYHIWYNAGGKWNILEASSAGTNTVTARIDTMPIVTRVTVSSKESNPLPVSLLFFEAKNGENEVFLNWATETEINNDFFTIERSVDAENWEELLEVPGAGSHRGLLLYKEVDREPLNGISYYRLKQTDYNGAFSYSTIRTVNRFNAVLNIFPNPSTDGSINVSIKGYKNKEIILELRDVLGSLIYSRNYKVSMKDDVWEINDLLRLSNGLYTVSIFGDNQYLLSEKILITK